MSSIGVILQFRFLDRARASVVFQLKTPDEARSKGTEYSLARLLTLDLGSFFVREIESSWAGYDTRPNYKPQVFPVPECTPRSTRDEQR